MNRWAELFSIAALKAHPDLAGTEECRARFHQEAKAVAALDHPNIVQICSVEESDGVHFIAMQLVEGKTLRELLPKNGFPLSRFFDIAIPLAVRPSLSGLRWTRPDYHRALLFTG